MIDVLVEPLAPLGDGVGRLEVARLEEARPGADLLAPLRQPLPAIEVRSVTSCFWRGKAEENKGRTIEGSSSAMKVKECK